MYRYTYKTYTGAVLTSPEFNSIDSMMANVSIHRSWGWSILGFEERIFPGTRLAQWVRLVTTFSAESHEQATCRSDRNPS